MIRLECAAPGCANVTELPDGSTVRGVPAAKWFRAERNYRCKTHAVGMEYGSVLETLIREFKATVVAERPA